ncbi:hypothetical protein Agub_g11557, partial [Astrephomene gubernaculifera]
TLKVYKVTKVMLSKPTVIRARPSFFASPVGQWFACKGTGGTRQIRCLAATPEQQPPQEQAAQETGKAKYRWTFYDSKASATQQKKDEGRLVLELPLTAIRRPLGRTRANDPHKVAALMESIREIGLQEPIDVLEVEGVYYGFSGCHRFEAHQRLGADTIRCRVRKATREVLRMHLM